MKQTKNFNINVPELGDKPDITQVSDAIQALEDALAGTLEVMNASIQGSKLTLTSGSRTTKRTKYYEGMAIKFVAPIQINPNALTTVSVDGLSDQTLEIPYLVNAGDSVDIIYKEDKFVGAITAIQRSNAIDSTSDVTVATSLAVKTINDKKAEKTVQIIAGNGLTGGGDISTSRTINVVSADDGITVNADNIKLNIIDSVTSASRTRPTSGNAVKTAYDKATEALQKANTMLPNGGYSGSGQQLKNEIDVINNNRFKIMTKSIGNTSTSTDLNTIVNNGFYVSVSSGNLFINTPTSDGAFELTVTGITDGKLGYKTQLIKSYNSNVYYVRTNKHWSGSDWTPWRQLAFDDEVYKRCRFLENGLPTAESILNLEPGIYNVAMSPIFELPNGYYTVQRLNSKTESGDNTVIVYKAGSGEKFWITSFNSNRWTGWKEFNHCPYNVGDFYLTSNTRNPSLIWHGTSWELIEGRMLIGAKSGQFNLGTTGGNQNINLALGQLPRFRLQVDSFSLGRGSMNITGSFGSPTKEGTSYGNGAFGVKAQGSSGRAAGAGGGSVEYNFNAATAWTGTTTSASPYTNYVGNGEAINIMNPYLAINIWKRIG